MNGSPDNRAYYARRAREERRLEETSADTCARHIHRQLAEEYERRARRDRDEEVAPPGYGLPPGETGRARLKYSA